MARSESVHNYAGLIVLLCCSPRLIIVRRAAFAEECPSPAKGLCSSQIDLVAAYIDWMWFNLTRPTPGLPFLARSTAWRLASLSRFLSNQANEGEQQALVPVSSLSPIPPDRSHTKASAAYFGSVQLKPFFGRSGFRRPLITPVEQVIDANSHHLDVAIVGGEYVTAHDRERRRNRERGTA
jgi:hypothetical protein